MNGDVQRELEAVIQGARDLTQALDDATINRRPPSGGWCAAECLDHLTITARRMIKAMETALDLAPAVPAPYQMGLAGRAVLYLVEPPVRISKCKAAPEFHGVHGRAAHLVLSEFTTAHQELIHQLPAIEARDQNVRCVVSPFDPSGRTRYSLGLAQRIIAAHARRHLWQVRKVLEPAK